MPMIIVSTNLKISTDQANRMKSDFGKMMDSITGKNENQLMLNFHSEEKMFFRGLEQDCALVRMLVFGSVVLEEKQVFTAAAAKAVEEILSLDKSNIYVVIDEYQNWGVAGTLK